MNSPYANQPGNQYVSLALTLPPNTVDYHVNSENESLFPDWNENWFDRKFYTSCTIKNLDNPISIKFHDTSFTAIPITIEDIPAIIEPFNFRDVFLTNNNLEHANFDITFWNGQGIVVPPPKPTNLSASEVDGNVVLTFYDNSVDEKFFVIERSSTSETEGFAIIKEYYPSGIKQIHRNDKFERTYVDDTVASGTEYWYRIRSSRTGGFASPYSNIENITTS